MKVPIIILLAMTLYNVVLCEPQNVLPDAYYHAFRIVNRDNWWNYLAAMRVPWSDRISVWSDNIYGSDIKIFERTDDPNYFNVIYGNNKGNHTILKNVRFDVPHNVDGPFGKYRVVFTHKYSTVDEQWLDESDRKINPYIRNSAGPAFGSGIHTLTSRYLFRICPDQYHRDVELFSKWTYQIDEELGFFRKVRNFARKIAGYSP